MEKKLQDLEDDTDILIPKTIENCRKLRKMKDWHQDTPKKSVWLLWPTAEFTTVSNIQAGLKGEGKDGENESRKENERLDWRT